MKFTKLGITLALLCISTWTTTLTAEEKVDTKPAKPLKVGDLAPEFEMMGSDGKTYKLSQFKGKSGVIVAWYPKAFTGG